MGASATESRLFYRDFVLTLVFIPAVILVVLLIVEQKFNVTFWVCTAIAVTAFYCATKRLALLAALLGIFAIRFAFGSLIYRSVPLFLSAVGFAVAAVVSAFWDPTDYPDDDPA